MKTNTTAKVKTIKLKARININFGVDRFINYGEVFDCDLDQAEELLTQGLAEIATGTSKQKKARQRKIDEQRQQEALDSAPRIS